MYLDDALLLVAGILGGLLGCLVWLLVKK